MMKNLLILPIVLAIASTADAELFISVDGFPNAQDCEVLMPSDITIIGVWGDGQTDPSGLALGIDADVDQGSLDIAWAEVLYPGTEAAIFEADDPETAAFLGLVNPFIYIELTDLAPVPAALEGMLVDGIIFHMEGGQAVLRLVSADSGIPYDTQCFWNMIPEPITFALFGLGGLFLRRRR